MASHINQGARIDTSQHNLCVREVISTRGVPFSLPVRSEPGDNPNVRKQYHFWPGAQRLDAWDVDRLIEMSQSFPVEQVRLDDIDEIDSTYWYTEWQTPTVRSVVEHCELIRDVDLNYPIILGPDGRVMDGMHRIARALLDGQDSIKAVRFSELPEPDYRNCQPDELPYERT